MKVKDSRAEFADDVVATLFYRAMGGDDDTSNDTVALTPNGLAVRWSL